MAYAKFGKDAVNKYFKERQPSYNMKIDSKNIGSLAASMEAGAKKQFKPTKKKTAQKKRNTPISDVDKKPRPKPSPFKPTPFRNGGMASRRAGIAKRGFNNFKGIF